MTSERVNVPQPPSSPSALADSWRLAADNLSQGWWIYYLHGESTYGDQAPFWIACAGGPEQTDYAEGYGPTPDAALRELAENLKTLKDQVTLPDTD